VTALCSCLEQAQGIVRRLACWRFGFNAAFCGASSYLWIFRESEGSLRRFPLSKQGVGGWNLSVFPCTVDFQGVFFVTPK